MCVCVCGGGGGGGGGTIIFQKISSLGFKKGTIQLKHWLSFPISIQ